MKNFYVEKAEKENDMTYVSKANGLKKKSNKKKVELNKLEEKIFYRRKGNFYVADLLKVEP